MSNLVLLEPFRTALLMESVQEGLVPMPGGRKAPAFTPNPDIQRLARQLLVLFESPLVISYDPKESIVERKGVTFFNLSWDRLGDLGLVEFVAPDYTRSYPSLEYKVNSFDEWWSNNNVLIDEWETLLIAQLNGRGKLPDPLMYEALKAVRLGRLSKHSLIGGQDAIKVDAFMELVKRGGARELEIAVLFTLNELAATHEIIKEGQTDVAHSQLWKPVASRSVDHSKVADVYEIVLETLLGEKLMLPALQTIKDAAALRQEPLMQDFRVVFHSWLQTFRRADADAEMNLRRDVRRTVLKFRNYPHLDRLSKFVAYASLPLNFVVGPWASTGIGVSGLGLEGLARRWRRESNWLGLCHKTHAMIPWR